MSSCLNVFMSECLHVWMSSCLKVFMFESLLDDHGCWKFSWPCAGFWRIWARPSFRVGWNWSVVVVITSATLASHWYGPWTDGPKLINPDCTVVDMNTSSTLASHWNGRTEGRTVRPDDQTDSVLKLPQLPCPNSLGGTVFWVTTHSIITPLCKVQWNCSCTCHDSFSSRGQVWPLQFENVDSAIDWRIEFI